MRLRSWKVSNTITVEGTTSFQFCDLTTYQPYNHSVPNPSGLSGCAPPPDTAGCRKSIPGLETCGQIKLPGETDVQLQSEHHPLLLICHEASLITFLTNLLVYIPTSRPPSIQAWVTAMASSLISELTCLLLSHHAILFSKPWKDSPGLWGQTSNSVTQFTLSCSSTNTISPKFFSTVDLVTLQLSLANAFSSLGLCTCYSPCLKHFLHL